MTTIHLAHPATCSECGFSTTDMPLLANHSCEVQAQGGRCEDFPACGHEQGDCNGQKYGSDEAIKQAVHDRWNDPDIDPMDPMYDYL
jgi:hypothetical protein